MAVLDDTSGSTALSVSSVCALSARILLHPWWHVGERVTRGSNVGVGERVTRASNVARG